MTDDQKLDQEAIEKLLASMNVQQETPAPEKKDENAQLGQDDIAALIASMNASQPEETVPAVQVAPPIPSPDSNQPMSQDDIANLLASMNTEQSEAPQLEPEPVTPAPAEDPNNQMSQDDIANLLASMNTEEPEAPQSEPISPVDENKPLSQEDIARVLAAMDNELPEAPPPETEKEIAATPAAEPVPALGTEEIRELVDNIVKSKEIAKSAASQPEKTPFSLKVLLSAWLQPLAALPNKLKTLFPKKKPTLPPISK